MTETWKQGICELKFKYVPKCLLGALCSYIGVGIVQSQTFNVKDRGRVMPIVCAMTFCCFGAAYNRGKIRKFFRIKGNFFIDCLIYSTPLLCCACVQEYSETRSREKSKFDNIITQKPNVDLPNFDLPGSFKVEEIEQDSPPASFHSNDFVDSISYASFQTVPKIIIGENEDNFQYESIKHENSESSSETDMKISEPEAESNNFREAPVEVAIYPLDGDDPLVYSGVVGTGPYSFLKGDPFNQKCPPPTYIKLEDLKKEKPTDSKMILLGMQNHSKGGLVCVDQEAIAKQKGVIGEVFKQVVSNISKGLGAVSISLPVRIFEPRSTAERLVDRFSFAPFLLTPASRVSDPVQRLLYTMAFVMSGLYLGSKQEKPFNPLLGETFQGSFPDGTQIYVEHTAHNPPTDHFDIIGKGYRVYGYYELDGRLSLNELTGEFRGFTHVQFQNQRISFTQPQFVLGGTMYGDRTLNWIGEIEFKDPYNRLSATIRLGDDKHKWGIKKKSMKKDDFIGKIWRIEQNGKKGEALSTVYGSWLKKFKYVYGDKKEKMWELDKNLPMRHLPADFPLPSDWRYREDLIWLFRKNLEFAAGWKLRVENKQRSDRMLRGSKH